MVDFFGGHTHCTKLTELTSAFLTITAADYWTSIKPGNLLAKYVDDTYLIVQFSFTANKKIKIESNVILIMVDG